MQIIVCESIEGLKGQFLYRIFLGTLQSFRLFVTNQKLSQKVLIIMTQNRKVQTFKYLIIGDSGVGKTSMLLRYCEGSFRSQYLSTIGVDFSSKSIDIDGTTVNLNIWDTAGQEKFRNITKSFYKGAHAIVVVYSVTDPTSYSHVEEWIDGIKETNPNVNMILVAAKCDIMNDRKVAHLQGEELAAKYGMQFIETSAKEDHNISQVFQVLARQGIQSQQKQQCSKIRNHSLLLSNTHSKRRNSCC